MSVWKALVSGLAGACAMTLVHQMARKVTPHAPRLDVLGMRAIVKGWRGMGQEPPPDEDLYNLAFVGDLASNALYFSLVGVGKDENTLVKGALLGVGAGVASATLPPTLGLGHQPNEAAPKTQILTVAWYLIGGLIAAAVYRAMHEQ